MRQCPLCDRTTDAGYCCGIDLTVRRRRFRMTNDLKRLVHVTVARKGLDDEAYRLRLGALGVASCKDFDRETFKRFMAGMSSLPDVPRKARG